MLSAKIPKQAAGYLESTFSTLEKTTQIHYRYIKNNKWKKHTYLNLEKAAQLAQKATDLKYISSENTSSELAEAIAIWQSELTNLDTTDKKSKINKKIGRALYANIAYARFGLDDMEGCIDACEDRLLLQGALGTGLPIEEMARTIERRYNENGK